MSAARAAPRRALTVFRADQRAQLSPGCVLVARVVDSSSEASADALNVEQTALLAKAFKEAKAAGGVEIKDRKWLLR